MHSKAVVTKPQNVFVMRDVLMNGYIGGGGTSMFSHVPSDFNNQLVSRLSLDEEFMSGRVPAMFPIPVPFDWMQEDVVSISDRMLPWMTARSADHQFKSFPGGMAVYGAMAALGFKLDTVHHGEDKRSIASQEYMTNGTINNSICFLGPHRRQSDFLGGRYALVPGTTHQK